MSRRGFTLLEVLVATLIMAIAVTGLLSNLTASLSNAARLTDADRAALMARRKMDELLAERRLPMGAPLEGRFPPDQVSGLDAGWRALVLPFETAVPPAPGGMIIQRVELEVWFERGGRRRAYRLEGYRSGVLLEAEAALLGGMTPVPLGPGRGMGR